MTQDDKKAQEAARFLRDYCEKRTKARTCGYGKGCPFFKVDREKERLYCGLMEGVFPFQWEADDD